MTIEKHYKQLSKTTIFLILFFTVFLVYCIVWFITNKRKDNYLQNDQMLFKLKKITDPLHPSIKNLKLYKGKKSYTVNKDKIYLCLTDENNNYYPFNHLLYVFLHEFAHYLNKDDIGHTENFYIIFNNLIEKANDIGIYDIDIPPIENYCNY